LCGVIVGIDLGTTDLLGSKILGAHFRERYVITVLWDVRNYTFVVWKKKMTFWPFQKKILFLISNT